MVQRKSFREVLEMALLRVCLVISEARVDMQGRVQGRLGIMDSGMGAGVKLAFGLPAVQRWSQARRLATSPSRLFIGRDMLLILRGRCSCRNQLSSVE